MPRSSNVFAMNIHAHGRKTRWFGDVYHFVMRLKWWQFLCVSAGVFIGLNTVFAALYHLQPGSIDRANETFFDAFFFSVQTMSTIGYGGMAPANMYADVLVTIEAALGTFYTAIVTGLTFARFARPTARVLFSDRIIVQPRDGVPHLMFRMANWRHNMIAEARVKVYVLKTHHTEEGEDLRIPVPLELVRDTTAFFWMSWLAMHKIDESSPLHGEGVLEQLLEEDAIIFVSLVGTDVTMGQPVHALHRYFVGDIAVGSRFVDIIDRRSSEQIEIDYSKFHEIEPIDEQWSTPELEAMRQSLAVVSE